MTKKKMYQPAKRLEDLNVIDNFMFNELTMQEDKEEAKEFCRAILEPIFDRKIRNIEVVPQKIIQGIDSAHHGIQVDAYVREYSDEELDVVLESTVYDIEPNTYKESSEEKRARYYHSLIDGQIFESGHGYDKLERVYVIFILTYDPFDLNRMMYTVKRSCVEEPDMLYDDGDVTIFLYPYGTKDIPSKKLQDMLLFLVDSSEANASTKDLERVHGMVNRIKQSREMGVKYMHTWERERHIREEGREEGLVEGREEGLAEGRTEGRQHILIDLVRDNVISLAEAAKRIGMPKEEFEKLMKD